MNRPWAVVGRSSEFEWNGRIGSRFSTKERADKYAAKINQEGVWDVYVVYAPVIKRGVVWIL